MTLANRAGHMSISEKANSEAVHDEKSYELDVLSTKFPT